MCAHTRKIYRGLNAPQTCTCSLMQMRHHTQAFAVQAARDEGCGLADQTTVAAKVLEWRGHARRAHGRGHSPATPCATSGQSLIEEHVGLPAEDLTQRHAVHRAVVTVEPLGLVGGGRLGGGGGRVSAIGGGGGVRRAGGRCGGVGCGAWRAADVARVVAEAHRLAVVRDDCGGRGGKRGQVSEAPRVVAWAQRRRKRVGGSAASRCGVRGSVWGWGGGGGGQPPAKSL